VEAPIDHVSDTALLRFAVFVLVSFVAFLLLLKLVLAKRQVRPAVASLIWVSAVVVVAGMVFAKVVANSGLPPWVYYGLPAVATLVLPPIALRMRRREVAAYLCAASLMPAVIHVAFSLLLGWKEYLPFWAVPSLGDLLS
jgi:hypothetical protein